MAALLPLKNQIHGYRVGCCGGYAIRSRHVSAYMVTDTEKWKRFWMILYLITDKKISNVQEILPLLEQVVQAGKSC